jgi:hypothetical protein
VGGPAGAEVRPRGIEGGGQSWQRVEEKRGPGRGTDLGEAKAGSMPCGNRGGGSSRDGPLWCHGPATGQCGPIWGNGKMGPAQEARSRFHNYSIFFSKRIELI